MTVRGNTRELIKLKDLYFMYLQIYHPSAIQLLNFYLLREVQWHPQETCGKIRKLPWLWYLMYKKLSWHTYFKLSFRGALWDFMPLWEMHHSNFKDRKKNMLFFWCPERKEIIKEKIRKGNGQDISSRGIP